MLRVLAMQKASSALDVGDARSIPWEMYRGVDTMTLAARITELHGIHQFDAIFVDGGGVGGGVVDRLRMLRTPVIEVQFGAKADRGTMTSEGAVVYANKRSEMWGTMRDAMPGLMIPDDTVLASDLTGIEYGYVVRDGKDAIQLEKKSDMQSRGLASPDRGDGLALTFSYPVQPSDHTWQFTHPGASQHTVNTIPSVKIVYSQTKMINVTKNITGVDMDIGEYG